MTFSLCSETSLPGVYRVNCANCQLGLGTMNADTIMRALMRRGPIICWQCRLKKCDYCGEVGDWDLPFMEGEKYRACFKCVDTEQIIWPPEYAFALTVAREPPLIEEVVRGASSDDGS